MKIVELAGFGGGGGERTCILYGKIGGCVFQNINDCELVCRYTILSLMQFLSMKMTHTKQCSYENSDPSALLKAKIMTDVIVYSVALCVYHSQLQAQPL